MAFALIIKDEDNYIIMEHVANNHDDAVHTDFEDQPQSEWRKAHHLIEWISINKPEWSINMKDFEVSELF